MPRRGAAALRAVLPKARPEQAAAPPHRHQWLPQSQVQACTLLFSHACMTSTGNDSYHVIYLHQYASADGNLFACRVLPNRARRALNLHSSASQALLDRDSNLVPHAFQQLRAFPPVSAQQGARSGRSAAQLLPRKRLVPLDEDDVDGEEWKRGPRKLRAQEQGLLTATKEGIARLQLSD